MLTFILSVSFFLILSSIIFYKRIRQNQLNIIMIIVFGSFISNTIINGILGLKIPYSYVSVKHIELDSSISIIRDTLDTLSIKSYIDFNYFDKNNYIKLNGNYLRSNNDSVEFKFVENNKKPFVSKEKQKRISNNKWVSILGLPRGKTKYVFNIPNDSIHQELLCHINKKFYNHEN
jgi:hypothetical protein